MDQCTLLCLSRLGLAFLFAFHLFKLNVLHVDVFCLRFFNKFLKHVYALTPLLRFVEVAVHIVFFLHEIQLSLQGVYQSKLVFVLLLEVDKNLFAVSRGRYGFVLDVTLELIVLGFVAL